MSIPRATRATRTTRATVIDFCCLSLGLSFPIPEYPAENPGFFSLNPFVCFVCAMAWNVWVVSLPPSRCVPASCFFHPHLHHWSKCGNSVEVLVQNSWMPFLTSDQSGCEVYASTTCLDGTAHFVNCGSTWPSAVLNSINSINATKDQARTNVQWHLQIRTWFLETDSRWFKSHPRIELSTEIPELEDWDLARCLAKHQHQLNDISHSKQRFFDAILMVVPNVSIWAATTYLICCFSHDWIWWCAQYTFQ